MAWTQVERSVTLSSCSHSTLGGTLKNGCVCGEVGCLRLRNLVMVLGVICGGCGGCGGCGCFLFLV